MPVIIKFYMVVGRDEPYENAIKEAVAEARRKFKEFERSINATFIRIKPEAVDLVLKCLDNPSQAPLGLSYLVKSMRQDGVNSVPALLINNRKIFEGQLPSPDEVKKTVLEEITRLIQPSQPQEARAETVEERKEVEAVGARPAIMAETPIKIVLGRPSSCLECPFYAPETGFCFLHEVKAEDVNRPFCASL